MPPEIEWNARHSDLDGTAAVVSSPPTGNISTTAIYYHNSGFYFDAGDEVQQKSYNLANLRVEYAAPGNRWSVAAWIDNAFNATVLGGIGVSPYVVGAQYIDPRLYGLSASFHY